jgi:multidrug resistance efflux pump
MEAAELQVKREGAYRRTQAAFASLRNLDQDAKRHEELADSADSHESREHHRVAAQEARAAWNQANHDFMAATTEYMQLLDKLRALGHA